MITTGLGTFFEEEIRTRVTETCLVQESVAKAMDPIQTNLLVTSRNFLPVTHVNTVAKVNSVVDSLLKYVAPEQVVFIGDFHINSSGPFVIIEGRGDKTGDGTKLNGRTTIAPRCCVDAVECTA